MKETEKLNKRISKEKMSYKPLRELNLMDDFLFDVTTVDLDACKIIIELSLGITLRNIKWKEGQRVVHNLPGERGIRMDFCVEDMEGNFFDVEMQKRNEGNIPKRTRFYQALIDAPLLESGEKGFDDLCPLYLVVICGFDLFHLGKYRYTFGSYCEEVPGLLLGDECKKVILNTKGKNEEEVEQQLIDFLHYVEKSDEETLPEACDERLRDLHKKVAYIKSNEEMEVTYMKMEERDRQLKEKGKIEGRIEGKIEGKIQIVSNLLKNGKMPEEIISFLGDSTKEIIIICQEAVQCAPDYAIDEIYKRLEKSGGLDNLL